MPAGESIPTICMKLNSTQGLIWCRTKLTKQALPPAICFEKLHEEALNLILITLYQVIRTCANVTQVKCNYVKPEVEIILKPAGAIQVSLMQFLGIYIRLSCAPKSAQTDCTRSTRDHREEWVDLYCPWSLFHRCKCQDPLADGPGNKQDSVGLSPIIL